MAAARYTFDSVRSCVWVSGRSSLHPINTETRGITGWFETSVRNDGSLDLDLPVSGELELAVERLTSGNQLYDHELRRRMDARRFPTISGRVANITAGATHRALMCTEQADTCLIHADLCLRAAASRAAVSGTRTGPLYNRMTIRVRRTTPPRLTLGPAPDQPGPCAGSPRLPAAQRHYLPRQSLCGPPGQRRRPGGPAGEPESRERPAE